MKHNEIDDRLCDGGWMRRMLNLAHILHQWKAKSKCVDVYVHIGMRLECHINIRNDNLGMGSTRLIFGCSSRPVQLVEDVWCETSDGPFM